MMPTTAAPVGLRALALAILAALLIASRPALAQGPGGNFTLTLDPPRITFPTPGIAEFERGWVDSPPIAVSVVPSNRRRPWTLYVRGTGPDLGGYGKPIATLLVRTGSSGWIPLSVADLAVGQGVGNGSVVLQFRLLLDWSLDAPGTYAADLDFTASHR